MASSPAGHPRRALVTGGSGFIGTFVVARLRADGWQVRILDRAAPALEEHADLWTECDVLDSDRVQAALHGFQPHAVLHLAARVDCDGTTLDEYRVNVDGTANVVAAIQATPSVERFIATSTQFVCRPGHLPAHDEDWDPHTVYGESKVANERHVRAAGLQCTWTIVRPTNIWGPLHPRYPHEFWRVVRRGLYLHPRGRRVVRSYGYVANVADQYGAILDAPVDAVHGRVFYVGDPPLDLDRWVHGFARALTGKPARTAPWWVLRTIAMAGDALGRIGVRFPLTGSRLRSMTEDYPTPMEPTFAALGQPRVSVEEGIAHTARWLEGGPALHPPDGPAQPG